MSCGCKCSYCCSCNQKEMGLPEPTKASPKLIKSLSKAKDLYTKKQAD